MSHYDEAYKAAKSGEDWYDVQRRLGDTYDVKRAFDSGASARRYGSDNAGGAGFGGGFGFIVMGLVLLYMGAILYSPLLAITYLLLKPIFPDLNRLNGTEGIFYIIMAVVIVYFLSCGFEYLRARMLEARVKNRDWKKYFIILFTVRILGPGITVYLFVYFSVKDSYSNTGLFTYPGAVQSFLISAVLVLILMWRIKVLNADNRYYLTKWAFDKGVRSMDGAEPMEKANSIANKNEQLQSFYVYWLLLSTFIGVIVNYIIASFYPGPLLYFELPMSIIFTVAFTLSALLAKMMMDRSHGIFQQHAVEQKPHASAFSLMLMNFLASLSIWFWTIKLAPWLIQIGLYMLLVGIQIYFKIRKKKQTKRKG